MGMNKITENAWLLALGNANAILLQHGGELTLIDAGFPGKAGVVLDAIAQLGKRPTDLKHLVFTHSHPDHIGSAAAIVRATGARTYMHAVDAPLAESGGPFRPMTAARGLVQRIAFRTVWDPNEQMEPFKIDQHIADAETLPLAGGLHAIHVPGHDAGQLAFLWQGSRLLIAGDVFTNIFGLADPIGFEDEAEGRRSQRKLAALQFDRAVFGHGNAILSKASERFRRKMR
ncbi:MBL fold metallo-hydrolase [Methylovirgula sp. 4M-Z18]|uniref:MBL fold metallo-hydrolase n=1 Tax=Methylovirgula sp. 4M-Z18 TaxID=2293567 RepID=UPI001313E28E|nr:MBL fold metallo-hydrolase [Methylovirgula sp. 4M-Z18]